jgi:hypothetical protein
LCRAVAARLSDSDLVAREGERAAALAAAEAGILEAVLAHIEPWLADAEPAS